MHFFKILKYFKSKFAVLRFISELVVLVHSFEQLLLKNVLENMNKETMNGKITSKPGRKRRGRIVLHIKCLSVYFISLFFCLASSQIFHFVFYELQLNRIQDLGQINPIDANCVRVITLAESNEASDLKKRKWERNSHMRIAKGARFC